MINDHNEPTGPQWVGGIKYNDKSRPGSELSPLTRRFAARYARDRQASINQHNIQIYNAQINYSAKAADEILERIWCDNDQA